VGKDQSATNRESGPANQFHWTTRNADGDHANRQKVSAEITAMQLYVVASSGSTAEGLSDLVILSGEFSSTSSLGCLVACAAIYASAKIRRPGASELDDRRGPIPLGF
jgi:hypothetical protein